MTTAIILNVIFATGIFATIVGMLARAIVIQSRDDGRDMVARPRAIDRRRVSAGHSRRARLQAGRIQGRHGHGLA